MLAEVEDPSPDKDKKTENSEDPVLAAINALSMQMTSMSLKTANIETKVGTMASKEDLAEMQRTMVSKSDLKTMQDEVLKSTKAYVFEIVHLVKEVVQTLTEEHKNFEKHLTDIEKTQIREVEGQAKMKLSTIYKNNWTN